MDTCRIDHDASDRVRELLADDETRLGLDVDTATIGAMVRASRDTGMGPVTLAAVRGMAK